MQYPSSTTYMFRHARRPGRRGLRNRLLAGLFAALASQAGMAESSPLLLVQPMEHTPVGNVVAQHFVRWMPHYLGEKATLHRPSNAGGLDASVWAARSGPPERTLVLMSQLWLGRLDALPAARVWVPLQIVLQGSWCLMAPEARHLPDFAALQAWLRTMGRPVRLGLPFNFGFPELWMQAMSRKTGLTWQASTYGTARQTVQALAAGKVDLVLDRCGDSSQYLGNPQERERSGYAGVQVLAQVGAPTPLAAATFAQWQLPPLPLGWMAWFASESMPEERREAVGKALYAILLRPDTQALIAAQQQQPVRMSPSESQNFVRRAQVQSESLRNWLERSADPLRELNSRIP